VVTRYELGRGEGRKPEAVAVLSWDLNRIEKSLINDQHSTTGLKSLFTELDDIESEIKFLQKVKDATLDEQKELKARGKEIGELKLRVSERIQEQEDKMALNNARRDGSERGKG
jgi:hypothetical protein